MGPRRPAHLSNCRAGADLVAQQGISRVSDRWKGKLAGLSGDVLGKAIAEYEAIDEIMGRVMSYAQLVYAGNVSDPEIGQFYQSMQERVNDISADILFSLELNEIDDKTVAKQLKSAPAANTNHGLTISAPSAHQLSEEIERLLHDKRIAGKSAWSRLFDETMEKAAFRIRWPAADFGRGHEHAVEPG